MPLKFSMRVVEEVDPAQPFVYNEELIIKIYKVESGLENELLQTFVYGPGSQYYRIDLEEEHYIANYKTSKTPAQYLVEVKRLRNDMLIGSFSFVTEK